jgi:hypothetical protein
VGGGRERAGRAFGETRALDQRGQRECRGEERHQRHNHRQSGHGRRAEKRVKPCGECEHEHGVQALWSERQRSDRDYCQNDVSDKHRY